MALLRFMCRGRVNKPLPSALVTAFPAIKTNLLDLQTYARKVNLEDTQKVAWGNETDYIWFDVDLAIPQPIPAALQVKLPAIRAKIQQLKSYAVNTGEAMVHAKYHICLHDEGRTCGPEQDI